MKLKEFDNILISENDTISEALIQLNKTGTILTLFVIENNIIKGTITDGDIRRALIKGMKLEDSVQKIMNKSFKRILETKFCFETLDFIKLNNIKIVPIVNANNELIKFINFNEKKSLLPIDAVIMAGGKGTRLLPLTKDTPKPMLHIGNKPIMEYNVELLKTYGISNISISVNYLAEQISNYFKSGENHDVKIKYLHEDKPLGTIGALSEFIDLENDYVLLMNSDLLTNIDLDSMFRKLYKEDASLIIATTDYEVQIPYGVIETKNNCVTALKEKPSYTFHSNAGIYIFKKELLSLIPKNTFFNATDLIDLLIEKNKKVLHYSIQNYWLDIGKHHDFNKANQDIHNFKF
jgi:dTDP-glucose pyrophosphorylase